MPERQLMKDGLDFEAVRRIAASFKRATASFPVAEFEDSARQGLDDLELKKRVAHVISALRKVLPKPFHEAARILDKIPDNWVHGREGDPLKGFAAWPVIDYVGEFGIDEPGIALPLLKRLTPLFSAEFAIRPFLIRHPDVTLGHLEAWAYDEDPHVRRLVSEGTRPRLPWGQRLPALIKNPAPVLELLEELKDDQEEYVRRSVANNLNDISKDHPQLVVDTCTRWLAGAGDERTWIVRHAMRTLVKQGNDGALGALGFDDAPSIEIDAFKMSPTDVEVGDSLQFSFRLVSSSAETQRLVVDYAIHFLKSSGERRAKVFKLRNVELAAGGTAELSKRHSFKPISTRRYYGGRHALEVHVNGVPVTRREFQLLVPEPVGE